MNKSTIVDSLSTGLKRESLAYRIIGIVVLVFAVLAILGGIFIMATGNYVSTSDSVTTVLTDYGINSSEASATTVGVGIAFVGGFYIGLGVSLLVISIVNLALAAKVSKCSKDETATIRHAGSVGSIVVAVFFNFIALIFAIINFVKAKKNSALLAA